MGRTRAVLVMVVTFVIGSTTAGGAATGAPPTAGPTGSSAPGSAASATVAVQLIEGKVTPQPATAPAGPMTFAINNIGMNVHEFVVIKTELDASALPVSDGVVDESGLDVVGQVENIALRATPTLPVDLAPGHYALICNIKDHYGAGMHADFEAT